MENGMNVLSPRDRCIICSDERKSLLSTETVLFLYQPVMGADAAAVHAVFAASATTVPGQNGHMPELGDILKTLDMEIPRFYEACRRLEAMGLLRTFVRDVAAERQLIYQLQLPLSGQEFFRQTVLCEMLRENIGRVRYDQLKQLFAPETFMYQNNAREITCTLADMFDVREGSGKNLMIERRKRESLIEKSDLNFSLKNFKQMLSDSFVDENDAMEHLDDIKAMALLYGLDEVQLVRQLEKSFNVASNKVDFVLFRRCVSSEFEAAAKRPAQRPENEVKTASREAEAGLSDEERQLVSACEYYSPREFLETLKSEKNGYVTGIENHVVGTVVKAEILPGSVINVILHYFLCDEDNAQLSGSVSTRFEEFCNRFAQKGIQDPVSAMTYLKSEVERNRQKKEQQRSQRRSYRNGGSGRRSQPVSRKKQFEELDRLAEKQNADVDMEESLAEIERLRKQALESKGR